MQGRSVRRAVLLSFALLAMAQIYPSATPATAPDHLTLTAPSALPTGATVVAGELTFEGRVAIMSSPGRSKISYVAIKR